MPTLNVIRADTSYMDQDGYRMVMVMINTGYSLVSKHFYLDMNGTLAPTGGSYDAGSSDELSLYKAWLDLKACTSCDTEFPIEDMYDWPQGFFCEKCSTNPGA